MKPVEACQIVSENPPSEWPEEVLYPYDGASIFGNTAHQAMDRTRTISLIDALMWTGLCESKGEIRKAIKNNGIMVNRKKMTDYTYVLSAKDACPKVDAIVLEFGKYNFGIIELC
jgi:tyrosyl-tRNA synthetase